MGYSPLDLNCFAGKLSSPSTWSVIIQPNHPWNDPMGWGSFLQQNPTCFPGKKKSGSADGDEMGHLAKTNQTAELPLQGTITYRLVPWRLFFSRANDIDILWDCVNWYLKNPPDQNLASDQNFLGWLKHWILEREEIYESCLVLHLQTGRQQKAQPGETRSWQRPKMSDYLGEESY